jgi:hypothetical protein
VEWVVFVVADNGREGMRAGGFEEGVVGSDSNSESGTLEWRAWIGVREAGEGM